MNQMVVDTIEDFEKYIRDNRFEFSEMIVQTILDNLDAKEEFLMLEVYVESTDEIMEISMDPNYYLETLEKNLKIYEEFEEYEMCSYIHEAIQKLK
jgi:hypothetical protein